MDDSIWTPAAAPWLLLVHRLPPKPDYLRVKIRRRLTQIGALPVKNAVYVLPASDQAMEDFEWLAQEIRLVGGAAIVTESRFVSGITEADLVAQFNQRAAGSYEELLTEAREGLALEQGARSALIARLERRLDAAAAQDPFGAPERNPAEAAIAELKKQSELEDGVRRVENLPAEKVWVTRQGVFVDRIASAWLIRRFIDRAARFKFVPATGYEPAPGELRFDMFEGEYSHEGDRCTFETLLHRFDLAGDDGLREIAEIVHDLDLRDEKFGRPEAPGLLVLLQGLTARYASDAERIEHGRRFFDQLYSFFARSV
jgi:hypothetical protein